MEKIKEIIEKVKCTFRNICDTIKKIKTEVDFYKKLWDRQETKDALNNVFGQLLYLLKKIKPSKIEGDLVFGTGDPATTGQAIGAIAALYGFFPEKLHITPDFEEKKYEGNIHVKGKLRLIHVVIIAVKLIADRNFRYVVKKVLAKEGAKNEQQ
jgi:hypothetical protein